MSNEILDVRPFPQPQQTIECMMLPLQALFSLQRYPMDSPQRLHSYLVVLFTKGTGRHLVDFTAYPYQKNTLLFVAENQVHQWEINRDSDAFVVTFSKEFLYKRSEDREILESYRIFDYSLQRPVLTLESEDYERFLALFEELQREFDRTEVDAFKHDIYRNLLRTILLLAERRRRSEAQAVVIAQYGDFVRFREQVEMDYCRTRNVQDYATALGYSPKKLNQVTQAVLNKNAKLFVD